MALVGNDNPIYQWDNDKEEAEPSTFEKII
jgi:hypothetical protein